MSKNAPDTSFHTDRSPGMDELIKTISQAREQAQSYIGRGDVPHNEGLIETAVSMLVRAEDMLERGAVDPSTSATVGSPSTSHESTFAPASVSSSLSTHRATRTPFPLPSSAAPVNPTPGPTNITTQTGLSAVASLNSYSEPAIPSDRLTFSYLWKLWALQGRKTQQDIPTLGGKFLDLQLLALNINSLGGQAMMRRDASLWKRLAVQLRLIDAEAQDDEHSKRIIGFLKKTQDKILFPFEQYCITWSRQSEEGKNKNLAEYAAAAKSTKANLPSPMPEFGETLLPTSTTLATGPTIAVSPGPSSELHEAIKLVDFYFHGFYPGIQLHTKIERLLMLPPSELSKHTWTRKRQDFLSKFSHNNAGRTIDQVITYMAAVIQKQLPGKQVTLTPPSGWPINSAKVIEVLPPTSTAMFSPSLMVQANQFVERTIQAIEEVRPIMKRIELSEAHRQGLKALVAETYDSAVFFYRSVALHYMLFLNEKDSRSAMMHAMFIIEQFFLSSTGYPAHIMSLEYATTSTTNIRGVVNSMREAYAKRYQVYLRLKAEESRSVKVKS